MSNSIIHVRFANNGTVTSIGELPTGASEQSWFNFLTKEAGLNYEALAGGRGAFHLSPEKVAELSKAYSAKAA